MPAESDAKAVALIRLNIADEAADPDKRLLSDDQLETLLTHFKGSTNRASARALRIIAASEVLVSKAIRTQDLSTDGAKVADALRRLAEDFDAEADAEEADDDGALWLVPFGAPARMEGEERRRTY